MPKWIQTPENCVLRVINSSKKEGRSVGTAFLIADRLAVTCAHIVELAECAPGDKIVVKFYCGGPYYTADVLEEGYSPVAEADIAFLRLRHAQWGSWPARLISARNTAGHFSRCLGYPDGAAQASWSSDTISGLLTDRRSPVLQLESRRITRGFSGSPVFDTELQGVVGMISWGYNQAHAIEVHAITADTIAAHCPKKIALKPSPLWWVARRKYSDLLRVTQHEYSDLLRVAVLITTSITAIPVVQRILLWVYTTLALLFMGPSINRDDMPGTQIHMIMREPAQTPTFHDNAFSRNEAALAAYLSGTTKLHLGWYQEAIAEFTQALAIDPKDIEAYIGRGTAYAWSGSCDLALQDFDTATQLNFLLMDPLIGVRQGHWGEISPRSFYAEITINRGIALALVGKTAEAAPYFDAAQEISPGVNKQYSQLLIDRAAAVAKAGRVDEAFQALDGAEQLSPRSAQVYRARGDMFVSLKQYERAIQNYDKVLELDPQNGLIYRARGDMFVSLKQYERAIQDYDKALEIDPRDSVALVQRGLAYESLGKYLFAVNDYNQALEINEMYAGSYHAYAPDHKSVQAGIYYRLAVSFQALGENKEALACFRQVLEMSDDIALHQQVQGQIEALMGQ